MAYVIEIPQRLRTLGFRFVRLREKVPIDLEWHKQAHPHDSPVIREHIKSGNNYGVATGYGNLVVIDFDSKADYERLKDKLLPTYTVRSGGGLPHLYYIADDPESFKILDDQKNTILDFQGTGKQVVGPSCLHRSGNRYRVINDIPIASISLREIKAVFSATFPKSWLPRKWFDKQTQQVMKRDSDSVIQKIKERIKVPQMLQEAGISINKNPTECPFHSSKGGKCLSFTGDLWHCFHCDEGGDIFTLYMLSNQCNFHTARRQLGKRAGIEDSTEKGSPQERLAGLGYDVALVDQNGQVRGNLRKDVATAAVDLARKTGKPIFFATKN